MNSIRISWVSMISSLMWFIEKIFFYPKLSKAYKSLNLIDSINLSGRQLTVLDIGANKGQSISFFKRIYPKSKIFAFEPSEKVFKSLTLFVKKMSYGDVSLYQTGVGKIHGVMNFYESVLDETSTFELPNHDSRYLRNKNRLLFQNKEDAFNAVTAEVTTLDKFLVEKQIGIVDILKIDVEGFELMVLEGSKIALSEGRIGVIQFERHSDDMREDRYHIINELLLIYGFRQIYEIKHPFGNFRELLYQRVGVDLRDL